MSDSLNPADEMSFKRVLGHFATGLVIVTADSDGRPAGMTCQSFASVSIEPPLVAFFAHSESRSWAAIRSAGTFCVNVLGLHQEQLARLFATPGINKFKDVEYLLSPGGAPILGGIIAWIECTIEQVTETGDHDCILGRLQHLAHVGDEMPLLYFRGGFGRFAP